MLATKAGATSKALRVGHSDETEADVTARPRVETRMYCVQLRDQRAMTRESDRQIAEGLVRVSILNDATANGIPVTKAGGQIRQGTKRAVRELMCATKPRSRRSLGCQIQPAARMQYYQSPSNPHQAHRPSGPSIFKSMTLMDGFWNAPALRDILLH